MSIHTFYRCAVWVPLLVPLVTLFVLHSADARPTTALGTKLVQIVAASGVYGGIPYALLAGYATWWIDGRPEHELRRRALAAPLWMIVLWLAASAVFGALSRQVETFAGLFLLGTLVILPLGYTYVALVFVLRSLLFRKPAGRMSIPEPQV